MVTRIIEYQDDIQRTPEEAFEFLKDEIEKGELTHMVVIYRGKTTISYVPAAQERGYKKSEIIWDVLQWMFRFMS